MKTTINLIVCLAIMNASLATAANSSSRKNDQQLANQNDLQEKPFSDSQLTSLLREKENLAGKIAGLNGQIQSKIVVDKLRDKTDMPIAEIDVNDLKSQKNRAEIELVKIDKKILSKKAEIIAQDPKNKDLVDLEEKRIKIVATKKKIAELEAKLEEIKTSKRGELLVMDAVAIFASVMHATGGISYQVGNKADEAFAMTQLAVVATIFVAAVAHAGYQIYDMTISKSNEIKKLNASIKKFKSDLAKQEAFYVRSYENRMRLNEIL